MISLTLASLLLQVSTFAELAGALRTAVKLCEELANKS